MAILVKGCPFCGAVAEFEPWHGGATTKTMVRCSNENCRVGPDVTGETKAEAFKRWNARKSDVPGARWQATTQTEKK